MPPAAPSLAFDLVVVADPRARHAEGRCLASLLAAVARRGYRAALLPVLPPAPLPGRAFHPRVSALIEGREVALLDGGRPHRARLALVYHIPAVRHAPERPLPLRADRALLRVDQPWRAVDGSPLIDLREAVENGAVLCGARPALVANDAGVASLLAAEGFVAEDLWPPTSDLAPTLGEAREGAAPVGRHVAGGEGAWPVDPEELAAAYLRPGGPRAVLAEEAARLAPPAADPAAWSLRAAELEDPAAFLAGLDAYVLAADERWRPVLLPGLAEALAAGVPLVAPPALEPTMGSAAAYARPAEVPAALAGLTADRRAALREAAGALHAAATSPAALLARVERHLGPPAAAGEPRLRLRRDLRARRRVLFLSPNGIGMGHLTRLLAVARRCAADIEPVFLSMSQAVGVVGSMGYLGEYFPFHAHTGETPEAWNAALRARLDEAIAFHDARCVVFDGNVPYQGLVDCRLGHPNRPFVWIRRGLWRRDAGRATIGRARHFDLVVEPGELAAALDPGPTAGRRAEAHQVPPVLLLDPEELPDRAAARAELGLDPGRTAVLVQLGSRNNFDYAAVDQALVEELGRRPDVELVFVDWLIGEVDRDDLPAHVRRLRAFPNARYLRAFDLAVSAAGYNSFHELLRFGVPAVFVPNENPMMDAQELRALWAERQGLAHLVPRNDPYRLAWAVRSLLDPGRRAELRARCAEAVPPCDGAARIARRVEELAAGVRPSARPDVPPFALTRGEG